METRNQRKNNDLIKMKNLFQYIINAENKNYLSFYILSSNYPIKNNNSIISIKKKSKKINNKKFLLKKSILNNVIKKKV